MGVGVLRPRFRESLATAGSCCITTLGVCFSSTAKRGELTGWVQAYLSAYQSVFLPMDTQSHFPNPSTSMFRTGCDSPKEGFDRARRASCERVQQRAGRFPTRPLRRVRSTAATNLVWGDHNDNSDVFVRDRALHKTFLVSVGTSGTQGNRGSFEPVISAHGRFVAFSSTASNLVHGDNNSKVDVFMYDRLSHATRLISVGRDGKAGHGASYGPAISANARLVTFLSGAANLVRGDSNHAVDAFVARITKMTFKRLPLLQCINTGQVIGRREVSARVSDCHSCWTASQLVRISIRMHMALT